MSDELRLDSWKMSIICLAADHAGYELKEVIERVYCGAAVSRSLDVGAHELDPQDDYPAYMAAAAKRVGR